MYTKDAVVLPPGSSRSTEASDRKVLGRPPQAGQRKDHTFEIISLQQDGQYAYQVARWTLNIIIKTGEPMKVSGNTVRIFEHQPDGTWLTKVHIFNLHQ